MTILSYQRTRQHILLILSFSLVFFRVIAWAGSPTQDFGKTIPAINLNSQEQQAVEKKEIIVLEQPTNGKPGKVVEAVGIIEAKGEVIRDIVIDYSSYPEFMPNISRIEILEQNGTTAVINQFLSLPLGKTKKYRVRLEASTPDEHTYVIQWRLKQWPGLKPEETIRDTKGFWHIQELDAEHSLVLYHVYTDPGKVPFGLGWIVDLLSKKSVPEVLAKTRERAEERSKGR